MIPHLLRYSSWLRAMRTHFNDVGAREANFTLCDSILEHS